MTLGEFSFALSIVGALPYIWQIIRGGVRPERTTWFVWTLILALAVWSYRASGASDSVWFLVGDLVVTGILFLLSLWRGRGSWTRLDISCLAVAGLSLLLWEVSHISLFTVWGTLLADAVALVPTIVKSLREPDTESASTYLFSSVAALCGFVAVGQWNLTLLFYPAYLFLANFITALVVMVSKYQVSRMASLQKP